SFSRDWSSDVCSSDLVPIVPGTPGHRETAGAAEPRKTPESSIGDCKETAAAWEYQGVSIILRVIVNAIALWAAVLLVDGIEVSEIGKRRVGKECGAGW